MRSANTTTLENEATLYLLSFPLTYLFIMCSCSDKKKSGPQIQWSLISCCGPVLKRKSSTKAAISFDKLLLCFVFSKLPVALALQFLSQMEVLCTKRISRPMEVTCRLICCTVRAQFRLAKMLLESCKPLLSNYCTVEVYPLLQQLLSQKNMQHCPDH